MEAPWKVDVARTARHPRREPQPVRRVGRARRRIRLHVPDDAEVSELESAAQTLRIFDAIRDEARAAIASASDAALARVWSLRAGDRVVLSMPKRVILRSLVMNHVIHHRGQLSVYLRLNDVPLPSIYGPTADESWQG